MQILSIKILCNDLEKAQEFYCGSLGLKLLKRSSQHLTIKAGSSKIKLIKSTIKDPVYHFAFNIPHNQLKEALQWISPKAKLISHEGNVIVDFSNWNAMSFYFYDPLGNILEFIARFDLPNSSGRAFSADSIKSVSEIAIATSNVYDFTERMRSKYGMELFKRQPRLENFAAMGDDNGLIIVSKTGRHWFPTTKIAGKLYTGVTLQLADRQVSLAFNR